MKTQRQGEGEKEVAGQQARQVGQGTDMDVKVGCSQGGDRSPKGHRDVRQGPGRAFRTNSKILDRYGLRLALPPADCHSFSSWRKMDSAAPPHNPCVKGHCHLGPVTLHTPLRCALNPLASEPLDSWMLEPDQRFF